MKRIICTLIIAFIVIGLLFVGCKKDNPVQKFMRELKDVPEYTIILDDMKEEGIFFSDYYHKYKIIQDTTAAERTTDWIKVNKRFYQQNHNFLGMALVSKTKDGVNRSPAPPGYQYIGDPRYGQWRTDSRGNSFWEFYGKYALFRDLLFGAGSLMGRRNVYRSDYDDFRRYSTNGRPYYGPGKEYGTTGSFTQKSKPSFFERRKTLMNQRRSAFESKARSRVGRSRSSSSRSSGFGK
ncbi:hypothetical protein JXJ21_22805 [candidate division KSB1 bacterium]|nr:hypothetical protein [candidate division KSB1 bacterium]